MFKRLKIYFGCYTCAYRSKWKCNYFRKKIAFVFKNYLNNKDYCTDWCRKKKIFKSGGKG